MRETSTNTIYALIKTPGEERDTTAASPSLTQVLFLSLAKLRARSSAALEA